MQKNEKMDTADVAMKDIDKLVEETT